MNTHTPGPWKHSCTVMDRHQIVSADGSIIGGLHTWAKDSPREALANTRLVVAAPDGLAAAEKALAECVDLISTPAGEALAAFIAKARGTA